VLEQSRAALAARCRRRQDDIGDDPIAELGKLDVVLANAGICAMAAEQPLRARVDVSGVNFGGVLNTLNAAIPHLSAGASMVVTGSLAAGQRPAPGICGPGPLATASPILCFIP
jgi:NAD(P)-dependent dehydrogenase (short-subunit alcohol dehydrogenase family)